MHRFRFDPVDLPATVPALRAEVREFLAKELPPRRAAQRANSWYQYDRAFSRKLGARGWIGMVWSKQYGGHERSPIERYTVIEELLAAGAPVGAHWVADRQSAMNILRFGTEDMKRQWLPQIAAGETGCAIGMSEPNTGSDLASVRTRATKVDGGWLINGQKIWTSFAHYCRLMITLVRTSGDAESRHQGLSQFLLDLEGPGIRIQQITDMIGLREFNEIFFEDAFVPDSALLGQEGEGWKQVTSELSLERSGPERYLSSYALFLEFLRIAGPNPGEAARALIGRIAAHIWTLRQMSLSVSGQLAKGSDPAVEAAIVKDLGNVFEQDLPRWVQAGMDAGLALEDDSEFGECLAYLLQASPSFSLRGGTREILRGIIARDLGLR